jgi:hypothetical protein
MATVRTPGTPTLAPPTGTESAHTASSGAIVCSVDSQREERKRLRQAGKDGTEALELGTESSAVETFLRAVDSGTNRLFDEGIPVRFRPPLQYDGEYVANDKRS